MRSSSDYQPPPKTKGNLSKLANRFQQKSEQLEIPRSRDVSRHEHVRAGCFCFFVNRVAFENYEGFKMVTCYTKVAGTLE